MQQNVTQSNKKYIYPVT